MSLKALISIALLSSTLTHAQEPDQHQMAVQLGWLYLKPMSNNHTYAYYVAGTQPIFQDWHAQAVNPAYASAFELGLQYNFKETPFSAAVDWIHLSSSDSASVQGNQTLNLANIAFVAPPFEMSPPVFGIRHAAAQLNYTYDNVTTNLEKIIDVSGFMKAKVVGGLNILRLKQSISTTFSDFVGTLATDYSYALPPDPSFSFKIQSISEFMGVGPDLGLTGQLDIFKGLSIVGAAFGSLNVGITSVQENFTSTSAELTRSGVGVSQQQVTTPNKTQVVPGFDGKLGLLYQFSGHHLSNLSLEGGYRVITYMNAISTTNPQTLVQPGTYIITPEFSTGTMAIVSMDQQDRPFNLNGPYLTLKVNFM